MGRFGERIGTLEALAWAFLLSVVIALAALLVARRGIGDLADAWAAPKWLWLGALLGDVHRLHDHGRVAAHRHDGDDRAARRGPARGGRGDRPLRPLRLRAIALSWPRALGIALLAAGAALTLKR